MLLQKITKITHPIELPLEPLERLRDTVHGDRQDLIYNGLDGRGLLGLGRGEREEGDGAAEGRDEIK
jgi:hypothetical protein